MEQFAGALSCRSAGLSSSNIMRASCADPLPFQLGRQTSSGAADAAEAGLRPRKWTRLVRTLVPVAPRVTCHRLSGDSGRSGRARIEVIIEPLPPAALRSRDRQAPSGPISTKAGRVVWVARVGGRDSEAEMRGALEAARNRNIGNDCVNTCRRHFGTCTSV